MHKSYYDIGVLDYQPYSIILDDRVSTEELNHFNPNHDSLGRFARKAGSGVRTAYKKAKSAYNKANEVVDKVQEAEKERIIRSGNQAYVYKNRHKLSDKELDMAMTRIGKEKELKAMGRSELNKSLAAYGDIAARSFAQSAGQAAGKALFRGAWIPNKDKDKDKKDKGADNSNKGADNNTDDLKNDASSRKEALAAINRVNKDVPVSSLSNKRNGRYVDLGESYINPREQRYVVKPKDKRKSRSKVKTVVPYNTIVIEGD